jgi:hypothetical protein
MQDVRQKRERERDRERKRARERKRERENKRNRERERERERKRYRNPVIALYRPMQDVGQQLDGYTDTHACRERGDQTCRCR